VSADTTSNGSPPGLSLLVGAARSGTTLTRLLMDAHPEIGCPAEAGLPALMGHLARVWSLVHADEFGKARGADPGVNGREQAAPARWEEPGTPTAEQPEVGKAASPWWDALPTSARGWVVNTVLVPMTEYCVARGKRIYCDKSLDSVHYLALVQELFPASRAVLLFRHVMDTVASGIEASPWGFQAYGYAPYVQASPANSVAALASYWLDHVSLALKWEEEHPEMCHRVRYEDLVMAPDETVIGMQRFLGVEEDLSVLSVAFAREPAQGPGDYKVSHTTGVHTESIGHGKRVPVAMLPPPLLNALNEKLAILGYDILDRSWNTAERIIDGDARGFWAHRLAHLMGGVDVSDPQVDIGVFAVVAEDHRDLRWVIDPTARTVFQGDGDVDSVLTGTAEDLVMMLTAEENLGVLLRSGRVRHLIADEEQSREGLDRELRSVVGLLRRGVDGATDEAVR
jgi:protein-tyrosine sulfotransferase